MKPKAIHILIVEDNLDDALSLKLWFEQQKEFGCSFTTESAQNLASAVERISRGGIDGVILDLNLPDSKGMDTLRKIIEICPEEVAVFVRSGLTSPEVEVAARAAGADDIVSKTAPPGDVTLKLRVAIINRKHDKKIQEADVTFSQLKDHLVKAKEAAEALASKFETKPEET